MSKVYQLRAQVNAKFDEGAKPNSAKQQCSLADDVFKEMAAQEDIAFKYPRDGCFARAQIMVERLQAKGLKVGKVWTFANPDLLVAKTPNHPDGKVTWRYHVAPVIPVRAADGSVHDMVIDPSMFDRPVTVAEWAAAQHAPGTSKPWIDRTEPGQAPHRPNGTSFPGSGYWPDKDPPMGAGAHARQLMKILKRFEGKRGP